jgi:hypothetical protein
MDTQELGRLVGELGYPLQVTQGNELQALMERLDRSGDGKISLVHWRAWRPVFPLAGSPCWR